MLKNYLQVAFRNLKKNKLYSAINIIGLTVGITCSILILLWVVDEVTYDRFIPKHDRLYQVWMNAEFDNKINSWNSVPLPTYEAMKTADHRIVRSTVTDWGYDHLLTVGEDKILQSGYYVGEEFLEMFEFPLKTGDASTVLDDPSSIVITESLAASLFGTKDPLNQVIRVDDETDLKVTGILYDLPENSSFDFEFLLTWKHREQVNEWVRNNMDNWGNNSFQVFVELDDPANHAEAQKSVENMLAEHGQDDMPKLFFLYPMERWHLYSTFEDGAEKGGMIDYVQLFTLIAVFILVIACINFMNLSTARSEKRAKEVGIRKSIGSSRMELILQFMGESLLIVTIAYLIAILLVLLLLPSFNLMVDKQLMLDFTNPMFWIGSVILIFTTGILSGSYPAFYLSAFNPAKTLKGILKGGKFAGVPRKVLVILQFSVAIILLTGTLVIYQQIEKVRNRPLGYTQDHLIMIDYTDELREQYEPLKNILLSSGAVESMTRSNSGVTNISSNNFLAWPGKPEELKVIFSTITAEYDYTATMGIEMLQGRDFSRDFKSDSTAIIVNKAALDLMNLENPIGTELDLWGNKRTLVGVMDNVLMGNLYNEVKPLFMVMDDWGGVITLRLNRNQELQQSLATVEDILADFNPAYPFDFKFVDQEFQKKFTTIKLTRKLAIIFSILSILITSLGLFGLAAYTAEQRTKEIGIRKVMGASITSLVMLMSKEFTFLVLIAFLLATPFAWYGLDVYLDRYPIRIDIQWWIFPAAGLVALSFALLIVTNRARMAAQANPVQSLRNE
jgi:ABC-type antimicrobial peptide transport system permease subunit